MANKVNAILQDSGVERAVLAGITTHGADCLFETEDILDVQDFYWKSNQELFKILKVLAHENDSRTFDIPSIQAIAKSLGYNNLANDGKNSEYLNALIEEIGPSKENLKLLVATIYKLSLARRGWLAAKMVQDNLRDITGSETIDDIMGKIEGPIFEFTGKITSIDNNTTTLLGQNFNQMIQSLSETPKDMVGLPTGFPLWDAAIGGGLQPATVNIVAARQKEGKSFFCLNVARNLAKNKIPILYLDTELTGDVQLHRLISLISGVDLEHVRTGKFVHNEYENNAIWNCQKDIENLLIDHFSIAGMAPRAIISVARRWLSKRVGFSHSGMAKPCLIIYDYLKLMNDGEFKNGLQEYQLLGFLITALHNFAVKFKLPILATVQLNKDGIKGEGTQFASGSDRIGWLCSNFTILKPKSPKEFNEDPPSNGTKKLVVTDTRYGPGMEDGEYINIINNLKIAKFTEGQLFSFATQTMIENQINEKI